MTEPSSVPDNQLSGEEEESSLLDLLIVVAKHKKLILGLPLITAVLAAGISLLLPNIYTANTRILPPQQSQSSAAAMLAQAGGGVGGLAGGAANLKSPSDIYVAMLKTRTLADKVIERFGLMKLWQIDVNHPSDAYGALAIVTRIASDRDGVISIEVDDKDGKRAADLANAYADELVALTSMLTVTENSRRRLFFERQLASAKDNLSKAEAAARQALQTGGLVKVDEQGHAMVMVTSTLRGQISVKEVQINAMRTFASEGNPDLQLALQELSSLKRELARIEGTADTKPATKSPSGQGSESVSLLRDVKYYGVIVDLLAQQSELAKIDEAKGAPVIQVMDKAIEPDRKSKPKRSLIVLLSALAAGVVAILWAFAYEAIVKTRSDPQQAARLEALKRYRAWR